MNIKNKSQIIIIVYIIIFKVRGDNNNSIVYNSKDRSKNRDKKGEGGIGGVGSKG
jgi:hypothetical protein